jgi:hypothetical protein
LGRVEGDDIDVVFEVLQQLIKLLLAAAAVGVDLHLCSDALGHPRLNVSQVHMLLLEEQRIDNEERRECRWGRWGGARQ